MLHERKAAHMATYLIAKSGAAGLPRRKLLVLLYLVEREMISSNGISMSGDEFILTPFGPVMKRTAQILEDSEEGGKVWGRRLEWVPAEQPAVVVADSGAPYAAEGMPGDAVRLKLREPQPPPRWEDCSEQFLEWCGERDEGVPYLGRLSGRDERMLSAVWREHGGRDDGELRRHALGLPEVCGRTSGDLSHRAVLEALGFSAQRIKWNMEAEVENKARNEYELTWRRTVDEIEEDGDDPDEDEG